MKEIGGYIEFEHYHGKQYHDNAIKLNCSRNALAYLIKLHGIKKLHIPYFLCDSVLKICKNYNVEVVFYHIGEDFLPEVPSADFTKEWFYLVNYYGQICNDKIIQLSKVIKNLIVDNVQAFFQNPVPNVPVIYNCRKFFGVADGAYLYSDKQLSDHIDNDISYDRMQFLLGRFEKTANEFYPQYVANNQFFETEPIKNMSMLTQNIMCSIDYSRIKKTREANFTYLHEEFYNINKLNLFVPEGAFAYPLYIENGAKIRKLLQSEKIYIPTLWPDVFSVCNTNDLEYKLAESILPLPIDQRYSITEMKFLIERINTCIN